MRKIILALTMALLVSSFTFGAAAAPKTAAVIGSASGNKGDTVTLAVTISGCDAAKSMYICPSFDSEGLELVGGKWLLTKAVLSDWDNDTRDGAIAYSNAVAMNGDVMQLTFKIKPNAAKSKYVVDCQVVIKNGQTEIPVSVTSGTVTVGCVHSFSAWTSYSASQHKRLCTKCASAEYENHKPSADGKRCTVCGAQLGNAETTVTTTSTAPDTTVPHSTTVSDGTTVPQKTTSPQDSTLPQSTTVPNGTTTTINGAAAVQGEAAASGASSDGQSQQSKRAGSNVNTGDSSLTAILAGTLLVISVGLTVGILVRKKRKNAYTA